MPTKQSVPAKKSRVAPQRLYLIAPVVLLGLGLGVVGARARVPDNEIVPGVHVGNLDLSGKSMENARTALEQWADGRGHTPFTLRFGANTGIKRVWKTSAHQLGLNIDVAATLDAATRAGRDGIISQVSNMLHGSRVIPVTPVVTTDSDRLLNTLREIAKEVNRKPRNARILLLPGGGLGTRHDRDGLGVDIDASRDALTEAWNHFNAGTTPATGTQTPVSPAADNSTDQKPTSQEITPATQDSGNDTQAVDVELTVRPAKAAVTFEMISQINGELGVKHTDYSVGDRGDNIHLATRHIDGTLLLPGQIFSYNKIVGPRDESVGFKQAPVIIHGKLEKGIGGGICQVSSTLYNAALLSGLKIVQRSHHAFPVHYLPAGRDATVVDGDIDFQFQNNTDSPIFIVGRADGGDLSFHIFGKKTPGRTVTMQKGRDLIGDVPTEVETDSSLHAGHREVVRPGFPDRRVTWYRIISQDGKVVSREPISTHYNAIAEIIHIGTKARSASRQAPKSKTGATAPTTVPSPTVEQTGEIR